MQVQIKNFSSEYKYFIIGDELIHTCLVHTCLVPINDINKYKLIFEDCKTAKEVYQTIKKYDLPY